MKAYQTSQIPKIQLLHMATWAIGTGLTPTLEDIDEVHDFIKTIDKRFNTFKVLYGGSVKSSNSSDIVALKNVDGCLIGGASLKVDEFNSIIS